MAGNHTVTKECTICGQHTQFAACSSYSGIYADYLSRSCLLGQRDSLRAQVRHLHSQYPKPSTATPSAVEPSTSALSVSTLLSWADTVLSNVSLLESPPLVLRQWLKQIQTTDYNLSVAVAWDIQKAILDATTAANVQYSGSAPTSGPTSQSTKVSPNDTNAKWDGAPVDETGANEYPEENRGKLTTKLSDCQLQNEYNYWTEKVKNAPSWGAALGQANEFKINCEQEMKRREGLAKQDGTPISATLKWIEGEHTIFDYNGQYGILQSGRGWMCKYCNQTIGWHLNLASAKADCETHYLSTQQTKGD